MQTENNGRNDFDFIIGRWKVHNRSLRQRLKGSNDWQEFEGTSVARKLLGGIENIDEITFDRETGPIEGIALRLFDPKSQEWCIYWSSSTTGVLDTPMIGKFETGAASSLRRNFMRISMCTAALFGPRSPKTPPAGNKLFLTTEAKPGRPTGLWSLLG